MTEACKRYTESSDDSDVEDGECVETCGAPHTVEGDCVMGIDEAGRGPVMGPMVYCGFVCSVDHEPMLRNTGFTDSKALTPAKREQLLKKAEHDRKCAWFVRVLSPARLSRDMLRMNKVNLNVISHCTACALVRAALSTGLHVTKLRVDTVGDPGKYQKMLEGAFPQIPDVVVAAKADATFPSVGAASIVAKCTRDTITSNWCFREKPIPSPALPPVLATAATRAEKATLQAKQCKNLKQSSSSLPPSKDGSSPLVKKPRVPVIVIAPKQPEIELDENGEFIIKQDTTNKGTAAAADDGDEDEAEAEAPTVFECDHEFGCGYPSDPATRKWLEKHADVVFGYPSLIRFSWKTCTTFLAKHSCTAKWFAHQQSSMTNIIHQPTMNNEQGRRRGRRCGHASVTIV